jgi:hypothetical protein
MPYIGQQPTSVAFLTDTFSGNGSTTAFTLSAAPANTSSVLVAVSGVLQDPSTYSVSGTTLTFSGAPPSGTSNISVRFLGIPASGVTTTAYRTVTEFTATAGQTSFSVPSYTVGFIDVYRNGVMLGSADYTATTGTTVVLASGATAGDLVEVISFQVSSVLNALPQSGGSLSGNLSFAGAAGISGNLPFVGTGNRITGDFANATVANRTMFQSSVTNDPTQVSAIPNGTGTYSAFVAINNSTPTNAGFGGLLCLSGESRLTSDRMSAAGTYLPLTMHTGGSERMRIDTSGRVTIPFQPAFNAFGAGSDTTTTGGNPLPFSSLGTGVVNSTRSGGYNTSTYRFTAPVAGLYMFSVTIFNAGGAAYSQVAPFKNGSLISVTDQFLAMTCSGTGSEMQTGTFIIDLAVNDYVDMRPRASYSTKMYGGHSFFTGYLIG